MFKPTHRLFMQHVDAALALVMLVSAAPAAAVVTFAPSVVKPAAATPTPAGDDRNAQQQAELAILAALALAVAIVAPRVRSNRHLRSVAS